MANNTQKTALVTGASSGMGKSIARRLVMDGYKVYAAARQTHKMEDLAKMGATVLPLDITKDDQIRTVVETIQKERGGVDVLVNNAGFGLYGPMEDISLDEARYQFEVNVFGAARLTQLLLPEMRRKGAGTIINITSMGGKVYTLLGSWYHATKHALEGWSDSLRLELAPFGIKVVIVEPGLIETGFGGVMADGLLKRQGSGAYDHIVKAVAKTTKDSYDHGKGTDPAEVADIVSSAIKAKNPRRRYVIGKYAKPMLFIRKWLGDGMFERMILMQMK